ncbi:MAG: hypothetical protein K8I29_14430 [Alphaproteobacteria bacterium]|uniref:Uncharacterized protein n=1 Tax=Candidatus Nitrobium versatile TaxID=2884831 RepID=A0A953J6X4_9BACT|nr:hypothetical protein [Candidatus Nitrobium versatile]
MGKKKEKWIKVYDVTDKHNRAILSSQWCPLFGWLPVLNEPPSSIKSQCLDVILRARYIWGVLQRVYGIGIPPNESLRPGIFAEYNVASDFEMKGLPIWPNPSEVPEYPENDLVTARVAFSRAPEVIFRAQFAASTYSYGSPIPTSAYVEGSDGNAVLKFSPDQVSDKYIVSETNQAVLRRRDLTNYEAFSIVAIWYAWDALREMICKGKPDSDSEVITSVEIGLKLQARAESLLLDKEAHRLMEEATRATEELQENNERRVKAAKDAGLESGNRRREEAGHKQEYFLDLAAQILAKNPGLTPRYLPQRIHDNLLREGKPSPTPKTIRKYLESLRKK